MRGHGLTKKDKDNDIDKDNDKGNDKDNPRDLWHLRHWLQFRQLRTWIHDNLCYLTIKSDTGQSPQFLRCFCQYLPARIAKKVKVWKRVVNFELQPAAANWMLTEKAEGQLMWRENKRCGTVGERNKTAQVQCTVHTHTNTCIQVYWQAQEQLESQTYSVHSSQGDIQGQLTISIQILTPRICESSCCWVLMCNRKTCPTHYPLDNVQRLHYPTPNTLSNG